MNSVIIQCGPDFKGLTSPTVPAKGSVVRSRTSTTGRETYLTPTVAKHPEITALKTPQMESNPLRRSFNENCTLCHRNLICAKAAI